MSVSYNHSIEELVDKRIASLQYLKDVQSGSIFWLNTIQFSRKEFSKIATDDSKNLFNANHYFVLGGSIPNLLISNPPNLTEYLTNFLLLMREYGAFISPTPEKVVSKPKMSGAVAQVGRRLFKSRNKHPSGANGSTNGSGSTSSGGIYGLGRNHSTSNLTVESESVSYNLNGSSVTMIRSSSSSSETSTTAMPVSSNGHPAASSISGPSFVSHIASLSVSSSSSSPSTATAIAPASSSPSAASTLSMRSRPASVIASATSFSSLKTAATNGFGRHRQEKSNGAASLRDSISSISAPINTSSLAIGEPVPINSNGNSQAAATNTAVMPAEATLVGTAGSQIIKATVPSPNGQYLTKEFPHLAIYHMPFSPDMYETFQTLCEVLIEAYKRIGAFLSVTGNSSTGEENNYNMHTSDMTLHTSFASFSGLSNKLSAGSDSYELLLKVDEHVKKFIISPTVRGIDMMSKSLIYEETKRLDNILIHTK